jgi:hypothetical protein
VRLAAGLLLLVAAGPFAAPAKAEPLVADTAGYDCTRPHPDHDPFSARSTGINDTRACGRTIRIPSPDGRSAVVAVRRGEDLFLVTQGAIGAGRFALLDGPNQGVLWAPDSRAFFVTTNGAGLIGDYHLRVGARFGGRLALRDLSRFLYRAFGHPTYCYGGPEDPNVAGVAFLGSSRRLLVAVQIMNHTVCDSFGTFRAYIVDPYAPRVIESIGQIEAKRRFRGLLGPFLTYADDACIAHPLRCVIRVSPPLRRGRPTNRSP